MLNAGVSPLWSLNVPLLSPLHASAAPRRYRAPRARPMIALYASTATAALQHAPRTRRDALGLGLAAAAAAPYAMPIAAAASSKYPSSTTLADGLSFPLASFGLQFYDDATAERLTRLALEAGFRNFFAQSAAGNQRGFARAVKASGVPREELFICGSVVSNRALDVDAAYKLAASGCAANLDALSAGGITALDMVMLVSGLGGKRPPEVPANSPSSTPRQRQVRRRATSSLGQPRPASAIFGQPRPSWASLGQPRPNRRRILADPAERALFWRCRCRGVETPGLTRACGRSGALQDFD